ncbi:MAG: DUF1592 domain-containing protein, partial [Myxococcota bacterium]
MRPILRSLSALVCLGSVLSCTGLVDDGAARPGGDQLPLQCRDAQPDAASQPLRHLTRHQYDNTVRDLLGDGSAPAADFPPDDRTEGYDVGSTVSPLLVEKYAEAAQELASRAVQDLPALLPCDPATAGEDACAHQFVVQFGRRAFRRPLTEEEVARYEELYGTGRDAFGFATGIELVVQAMLESPHFLYHVETPPPGAGPGEVVPVTGWEMASRLSYFLWSTMPDEALMDAAEAGTLDTPEGVEAQARRMLDDPRARAGLLHFFQQWLHLDHIDELEKNTEVYPTFDYAMARDLRRSAEAFVEHVLWDGDRAVGSLLLDRTAFVNERIGPLVGHDDVEGDELVEVALDPEQRAGVLSQPGLLALLAKADQSDP